MLTKRGLMGKQVNMSIILGNKQVEFRPLVIDELSHSMNFGTQFLEKHGFNVEITRQRLYSEDYNWAVPFTTRKDHISLTNTRTVFSQQGNAVCAVEGSRELGWGQLTPALDKETYTLKEWEYLQKESLGFPLSSSRRVTERESQ